MNNKTQTGNNSDAGNVKDGSPAIILDENLEISAAAPLLKQLQAATAENDCIVLNGSQIMVIDTAILQLLVAVFRQAQQDKCSISWLEPSAALCNTSELLGLDAHLCLIPATA